MTYQKLKTIIEHHEISENVRLTSDSGWECGATEMDGVYYHSSKNVLVFTQNEQYNKYNNDSEWENVSTI